MWRTILAAVTPKSDSGDRGNPSSGQRAFAAAVEEDWRRDRARLAQELHDTVGHGLTAISLHARRGDAEALAIVDSTAQQVMREVGGIVARLRGGAPAAEGIALPLAEHVGRAVAIVRGVGVRVTAEIRGGEEPVPPGLGRVIERAVREALVNAAKHQPGCDAALKVVRRGGIAVEVRSSPAPGGGPGGAALAGGTGSGQEGLRQLLSDMGGLLSCGPARDGSYLFAAWLPLPRLGVEPALELAEDRDPMTGAVR